jgi:hypothetical protein
MTDGSFAIPRRGTFLLVERSATSGGECPRLRDEPNANHNGGQHNGKTVGTFAGGRPRGGQASESALNNGGAGQAASTFPEKLPLPPIPYLDTLPWMNFGSESQGPGIDPLWLPNFNPPTATKNSASAYSLWNAESNPNRTATR